jgi:protocatechuate 3,4-dioxygenase beta subunit
MTPMAATTVTEVHPPYLYPDYKSTRMRAPGMPLVRVAASPLEAAGPAFPKSFVKESEADLTTWGKSAPLGEKMVLVGRVLDDDGRPVRRSLVEIWQANASGKYPHPVDDHDAPMDPNFLGKGQVLTDDEGRYRVVTVKPGAYPWQNHAFAWRPAHIHLSLFGNAYAQRLITQMFFPGDPLLAIDPIFNSVPEAGRGLLIADLDLEHGVEGVALGYRFDVVLRGSRATPMGL